LVDLVREGLRRDVGAGESFLESEVRKVISPGFRALVTASAKSTLSAAAATGDCTDRRRIRKTVYRRITPNGTRSFPFIIFSPSLPGSAFLRSNGRRFRLK
jgi:hypothetical protein